MTDDLLARRYYTVAEVAKLLRVSKMTVYRLCRDGDLDAIRAGDQVRIPEPELRRYLGENP